MIHIWTTLSPPSVMWFSPATVMQECMLSTFNKHQAFTCIFPTISNYYYFLLLLLLLYFIFHLHISIENVSGCRTQIPIKENQSTILIYFIIIIYLFFPPVVLLLNFPLSISLAGTFSVTKTKTWVHLPWAIKVRCRNICFYLVFLIAFTV